MCFNKLSTKNNNLVNAPRAEKKEFFEKYALIHD
jgi:hypothetical protein